MRCPGNFRSRIFNFLHKHQVFSSPQIRETAHPFPHSLSNERRSDERTAHQRVAPNLLGSRISQRRTSLEEVRYYRFVIAVNHISFRRAFHNGDQILEPIWFEPVTGVSKCDPFKGRSSYPDVSPPSGGCWSGLNYFDGKS